MLLQFQSYICLLCRKADNHEQDKELGQTCWLSTCNCRTFVYDIICESLRDKEVMHDILECYVLWAINKDTGEKIVKLDVAGWVVVLGG